MLSHELLTHLTTNNYALPQGTPTSTAIANIVFLPIDNKLIDYCIQKKLTYTRYVDDLVFSSHFDFMLCTSLSIDLLNWASILSLP